MGGFFHGGEAGELLGIAGALMCAIRLSRQLRICVLRCDSGNAIRHVFGGGDVGREAEQLLPGILLCTCLCQRLTDLGIESRALWVPREANPAHKVAYAELRRRRRGYWRRFQDYAPTYFVGGYQDVFQDMARNVQYGVSHRVVSANVLASVGSMIAV